MKVKTPVAIVVVVFLALSSVVLAENAETQGKPRRDLPLVGEDGITKPKLIKRSKVQPKISKETWSKIEGRAKVAIHVIVEKDGSTSEPTVVLCSQMGIGLEKAAIEAVKQWRYKPAKKDGAPVAVYLTIVISFALPGSPP